VKQRNVNQYRIGDGVTKTVYTLLPYQRAAHGMAACCAAHGIVAKQLAMRRNKRSVLPSRQHGVISAATTCAWRRHQISIGMSSSA